MASYKQNVLDKKPGAFGAFAVHMRNHGATYKETCDLIRKIQRDAGQVQMDDAELDALFDEEGHEPQHN